jgi:hypothetical protein
VRGICFTADITNNTPTTTASFANFVYGDAKTVARRHSASHHRRAIRAHDHSVIGPSRGGQIERAGADVRLQLGGATHVRKAERLRVDGPPSNKNGQATSGPAMLVQRGVHVDHQALPQTAFPPVLAVKGSFSPTRIWESLTRCCALVRTSTQDVGLVSNPHELRAFGVSSRGPLTSEAALSPSRDSRRRRAEARPWSCPGTPTGERTPLCQPGICPAGSSPEVPASPRPPRNP